MLIIIEILSNNYLESKYEMDLKNESHFYISLTRSFCLLEVIFH